MIHEKFTKAQKEKFMKLLNHIAVEQLGEQGRVGNLHLNTDESKKVARDVLQAVHTLVELGE